jgi:broad specificity phosphatase PhoE
MKYLLFIRHVETMKNIKKEFSKESKADNLTEEGNNQVDNLIYLIRKFVKLNNSTINYIYTSNSYRSIGTGLIISKYLNIPLKNIDGLISFNLGKIGGLTEKQTEIKYPKFYNQLKLYRNGLLNSYDINYPTDAEHPLEFEKRVRDGISKIMYDTSENVKIIILHRSVLTATYIHFARKYHKYPIDYYGFVPIENGSVTLLKYKDHAWEFISVNEDPKLIKL